MERSLVILLATCQIQRGRSQPTVDINPQKNIPGIGAFLGGGGKEKPVLDRWQFWLGIGLAAAIFIVVGYFAHRGYRNYKKLKIERRREQEQEEQEQKNLENDIETPPLPPENNHPAGHTLSKINVDELARRTGRKKKDILTMHNEHHHHHHRSSSLPSEAPSGGGGKPKPSSSEKVGTTL